jgi:hypothetical protein
LTLRPKQRCDVNPLFVSSVNLEKLGENSSKCEVDVALFVPLLVEVEENDVTRAGFWTAEEEIHEGDTEGGFSKTGFSFYLSAQG